MKKRVKKWFCFVLSIALVLGLMPGMAVKTYASAVVEYLKCSVANDGTVIFSKRTCPNYTLISSDTLVWGSPGAETWYVLDYAQDAPSFTDRITVNGTVNLILCDGKNLYADYGITVAEGAELNIYAQSMDPETMGRLYACTFNETQTAPINTPDQSSENAVTFAAIGGTTDGGNNGSFGTINIHGGMITAYGAAGSPGIGIAYDCGYSLYGKGGIVNIYSGDVMAFGGTGFNGPDNDDNTTISYGKAGGHGIVAETTFVFGGKLSAAGGTGGKGGSGALSGGNGGDGGYGLFGNAVTIGNAEVEVCGGTGGNGGDGTVNAGYGGMGRLGLGGWYISIFGTANVQASGGTGGTGGTGNNETGSSGDGGYGVGLWSNNSDNGELMVTGGVLTAIGGTGGYGGTGVCARAGENITGAIVIQGGKVIATGGSATEYVGGCGIATENGIGFSIEGGEVTATAGDSVGGYGAHGIDVEYGSGFSISGGDVTATGAGYGINGTATVTGGTLTASGNIKAVGTLHAADGMIVMVGNDEESSAAGAYADQKYVKVYDKLYPLWIAGVQVSDGKLSGYGSYTGEWKFTPADTTVNPNKPATLTLDNYRNYGNWDVTSGIKYTGSDELNIELVEGSDNKITMQADNSQGIVTEGGLNITGGGSLYVFSRSKAAISAGSMTVGAGVELTADATGGTGSTGIVIGDSGVLDIDMDAKIEAYGSAAISGKVIYAVDGEAWDANNNYLELPVSSMQEGGADLSGYTTVSFPLEYPLYIGDECPTSAKMSGEGWSFSLATDTEPATLTLTGCNVYVDYSGSYFPEEQTSYYWGGISWGGNGPLKLVLNGANTVASVGSHSNDYSYLYTCGIVSTQPLMITGTGSLTASGYYGIYVDGGGDIDIEGGTVTVAAGDSKSALGTVSGFGIYAGNGSVIIRRDAVVTALGEAGAISGKVKNVYPGIGWVNADGTGTQAVIAVSSEGQELSSYKNVQFLHLHKWSYAVDQTGRTITAACVGDGDCYITDSPELTIVEPTLTVYGETGEGISAEADLSGLAAFNDATGMSIEKTDIKYYNATVSDNVYTKGTEITTGTPEGAGSYVAELSLKGVKTADSESGTVTVSVGYTIGKASVTAPAIDSKTYTGEPQTAAVPESTFYTVTKNEGGTDAGSYEVELTLTDTSNYKWADSDDAAKTLEFKITKSDTPVINVPTPGAVTYDPAKTLADVSLPAGWAWETKTITPVVANDGYPALFTANEDNCDYTGVEGYDPAAHTVRCTVNLTVNKAAVTAPVTASKVYNKKLQTADVPQSTLYTVTANAGGTDAGSYDVVLKLNDAFNYKWKGSNSAPKTLKFEITKAAAPIVVVPTPGPVTYDPAKKLSDVALTGLWSWADRNIVPVCDNDGYAAALSVDDNNYDYTNVKGYDKNTHKVIRTVNLIVNPAGSVPAAVTANEIIYDGTAKELVSVDSSLLSGGTMYYALGTDETTVPAAGWSTDVPKGISTGNYYVWYRVEGDGNHSGMVSESPVNVVIAQALVNNVTVDITGWTYGDAAKAPTSTANFGTAVYSYSDSENGEFTDSVPVNAGVWLVKAAVPATDDYAGGSAVASFEIAKKKVEVFADPADKVYGEEDPEFTYQFDGLVFGDSFTGALSREEGEDVGEYGILAGTLSAGDNYEIGFTGATFIIGMAPVDTEGTPVGERLTYDGESHALVSVGEISGGTYLYALGTNPVTSPRLEAFSEEIPEGINAGSYYVWYYIAGDGNHRDSDPVFVIASIAQSDTIAAVPDLEISVDHEVDSVGKVLLPENWEWDASDADKELAVGEAVSATAVYAGEDENNYTRSARKVSVKITRTAAPDMPDEPDTPDNPDTPDVPDTPDTPDVPDTPDTPDTPDVPDTPDEPDTPDIPDTPDVPDTPDNPVIPDTPDTPDEPDTPVIPDTPVDPGKTDKSDKSDTPDTPVTPDTPGSGDARTSKSGGGTTSGTSTSGSSGAVSGASTGTSTGTSGTSANGGSTGQTSGNANSGAAAVTPGETTSVTTASGKVTSATVQAKSADGKAILAAIGGDGEAVSAIIVDDRGMAIASSRVEIGGKIYATDENGMVLMTGFYRLANGDLVYATEDGSLKHGEVFKVAGHRYNALDSGKIITNDFWITKKGNKVYANDNGRIVTRKMFIAVDGKKYKAAKSGKVKEV